MAKLKVLMRKNAYGPTTRLQNGTVVDMEVSEAEMYMDAKACVPVKRGTKTVTKPDGTTKEVAVWIPVPYETVAAKARERAESKTAKNRKTR